MTDTLVAAAEEHAAQLFLMINVVTRRAEQLMEGAVPAVNARNVSPIELALREVAAGRIEPDDSRRIWTIQPEDD